MKTNSARVVLATRINRKSYYWVTFMKIEKKNSVKFFQIQKNRKTINLLLLTDLIKKKKLC